jgi:ABC-type branched-subunit amino acid transport system substrate-binding protein
MRVLIALLLGLALLGAAQAQGSGRGLTATEQTGRRIYHDGIDRAGRPIAAKVAGSATSLKGKAMACGNCHGEDGRGRPESGVDPGDVTWADLTKPYGHVHANNRRHGAYDLRSFRRAMRDGVDPAGNVLEPAMPRYELDDADLDALAAYLKRLEAQRDPGITDTAIRIGTVLPTSGRLADTGRAVQRVLQGYIDGINQKGGVHGRRLQLAVAGTGDEAAGSGGAVDRLLKQAPVFALLAPLTARSESDFTAAAEAAQVPVVGPLTLFPESASASSTYVFHLLPGVPELGEAMAVQLHPVLALSGRPVVLLHAPGDAGRATAQALETRLRARGYSALFLEPTGEAADVAARLKQRGAAAVIVLAPGAGLGSIAKASADALQPFWLVPAPYVGTEILDWPRTLDGRIVLAYPTLPGDRTPAGRAALEAATGGEFNRGHQAMQVAALGAAMVLVEGLSIAGRDLSRQKLITALEGLQGFETGLMPRLSYNADRRIGSYGAYVVKVDLAKRTFTPLPDFVRLQ